MQIFWQKNTNVRKLLLAFSPHMTLGNTHKTVWGWYMVMVVEALNLVCCRRACLIEVKYIKSVCTTMFTFASIIKQQHGCIWATPISYTQSQ